MNPFFNSHQQNQQQGFGQNFDLNTALQNLARQIAPTGMTPEQIVRQKIQNREMTQEQFNQFASIADHPCRRHERLNFIRESLGS